MINDVFFAKILNQNNIFIPFNRGVNIIVGHNGCGKTTIIDAIHNELRKQPQNLDLVNGVTLGLGSKRLELINTITISPLNFDHNRLNENYEKWLSLYGVLSISPEIKTELESKLTKVFDCNSVLVEKDVMHIVGDNYNLSYDITNIFIGFTAVLLSFAFSIVSKNTPKKLGQSDVLVFDQIDARLHISIQRNLIKSLLEINPDIQIIGVTHSPSMIMLGNTDFTDVTNLNDFQVDCE